MKTRNPTLATVIRPATAEDIPTVIQLNRDGILLWSRGFQPVIREWMDTVCSEDFFGELIFNPEKTLLVAECHGTVCGTAYGYLSEDRFYVGGLYLSLKGHGIAILLMSELITQARQLGLDELSCTVHEDNHGALRFFRRLGWVHKDEEKFNGINYYNRVLVLP